MGQAAEERMTAEIAGTREHLSRDVDALYDKVSPGRMVERRKQAARTRLASLKDSVMGTAESAGGSAQGVASSARDTASSATSAVADTAQSAVGTVERRTQGAPLAAGLVAFGAGMIVSAVIPASEKEAQASRRITEAVKDSPVLDEAKAAGQEIGEHLKQSATHAAEDVRSSAEESVSAVKEEGRSAAQTVREEAPGT